MEVVGRFHLADGIELKVVTGIDDHSRICVWARASARPVCDALGPIKAQTGWPIRS